MHMHELVHDLSDRVAVGDQARQKEKADTATPQSPGVRSPGINSINSRTTAPATATAMQRAASLKQQEKGAESDSSRWLASSALQLGQTRACRVYGPLQRGSLNPDNLFSSGLIHFAL